MREHKHPLSPAGLLATLLLLPFVAHGGDKFLSVWKGKGEHGSLMTLRLLKPLPSDPSDGWLNSPEGDDKGDGDFVASRVTPAHFKVDRGPIVFESEKKGKYSGGRYTLRDGVLTICMLSFTPGQFDGRPGIPVHIDYSTCATMRRIYK
jgi:hypothetical protein